MAVLLPSADPAPVISQQPKGAVAAAQPPGQAVDASWQGTACPSLETTAARAELRTLTDSFGDATEARSLARTWLALGASGVSSRLFAVAALTLAAVLWGELGRGGFFRADLIIFVVLSLLAAMAVPLVWRVTARASWIVWSAGAISAAVLVSALANRQLGASGYALASVGAAMALGAVGASTADRVDRFILRRVVVDVAMVTALLAWVGVVFHLSALAELQAQGWRATANLGYANVTALLLLLGLLCAAVEAARSSAVSDAVRCWIIAVGVLTTQSRGVLTALAVCVVIFLLARRDVAWLIVSSVAWAAVAFVGVIPSVQNGAPNPLIATISGTVALTLLVGTGHATVIRRVLGAGLGVTAAAACIVQLNARVADGGSDQGRLRLWHDAVTQLRSAWPFGAGPQQLATFSNGHITQLFAHNDALQYMEYYGIFGVGALLVLVWQLALTFVRVHGTVNSLDWSLGVATTVAVGIAALVDFPLQVPVIPAVAALIVGTTVGTGHAPARSRRHRSRLVI